MTLPENMNAITFAEPGPPSVLQLTQQNLPTLDPGQVLIQVECAGVNRPDIFQRLGRYNPPPDADPLLGLEVSGTVVARSADCERFKVGDKVCALTHGGGYAEFCRAAEPHCLPIPDSLSWAQAAAFPETAFTVWSNVFDRAKLQRGETVLVHGGSSGIGTMAIQMLKCFDCTVIVTVGNTDKQQFCLNVGADHAIVYRDNDWAAEVQAATQGQGVDVVLDMVAGPYVQENINLLRKDGRYSLIAFLKGPKAELNLAPVMLKRITLTGSTLRPQSVAEKSLIAASLEREIWPYVRTSQVQPIIDSCFPLTQAQQAHERMESSQHKGKIVLQVRNNSTP